MRAHALKETWQAFNEDKAQRLAAALAYTTVLSIAPLFIVVIAIAGWFLGLNNGGHGHHVAEDELVGQLRARVGPGVAESVHQLVTASFNKPRQGLVSQIAGWAGFALGATALFSALQDSLNAVWHVDRAPSSWKKMLRDRLVSFGMILVVGVLLLATLLANAAMGIITGPLLSAIALPANPLVLSTVGELVSLVVVALAFALVYKVLPDVEVAWKHVWLGALVTAVLFVVGEALIGLYLGKAAVASAYGAAGSLMVLLLWSYYTGLIVLLGAEFTKIAAAEERVGRVAAEIPGKRPATKMREGKGMEQDPEAIRRELERTRERMGETVEALSYKTDVTARAKDALDQGVQTVKGTMSNVRESVVSAGTLASDTANEAGGRVASAGADALGAAVAVGAKAVDTVSSAGSGAADALTSAGQRLASAGSGAAMAAASTGASTLETAKSAGSSAASALSSVADRLASASSAAAEAVKSAASREGGTSVTDGQGTSFVSRYPFAFAAGTFAAGMVAGLFVPLTNLERRQVAPLGEQLSMKAQDAAKDFVDRATQAVVSAAGGRSATG
jgi:membrane protein